MTENKDVEKCICVDLINCNPDPVVNPDCPLHGPLRKKGSPIKEKCGNCQCYLATSETCGICRLKPPQFVVVRSPYPGIDQYKSLFPDVKETDWCYMGWRDRKISGK